MREDVPESFSYQINVSVVKSTQCEGYAGILTVIELPHMSEVTRAHSRLRGRFFREPAEALAAAFDESQRIICDAQRGRGSAWLLPMTPLQLSNDHNKETTTW